MFRDLFTYVVTLTDDKGNTTQEECQTYWSPTKLAQRLQFVGDTHAAVKTFQTGVKHIAIETIPLGVVEA